LDYFIHFACSRFNDGLNRKIKIPPLRLQKLLPKTKKPGEISGLLQKTKLNQLKVLPSAASFANNAAGFQAAP
jgi:hypothetical protein